MSDTCWACVGAVALMAMVACGVQAQEQSAVKDGDQAQMQVEFALEKKVSATVVAGRQPVDAGLTRLRGCGASGAYATNAGCVQ